MSKVIEVLPERKLVQIWPKAHSALSRLCEFLAAEKGLKGISYTNAASIAILEAVERREQEKRVEVKHA